MKTLGYYNGKYDELERMTVPMNDRVHWFGDGIYDASYSRNHRIFALREHVDRFFNSAGLLDIHIPCTKDALCELLKDMVNKVDSGEQFVYWQVTRGTQMRSHSYDPEMPGNLWIMLLPQMVKDMSVPYSVLTLEDTRYDYCNIKTLNLIPNILAAQKAERAGCDEAVFHRGEIITECTRSNIHIIKDGKLKTHPADYQILPGVARKHLIRACGHLEIPVNESAFTFSEMIRADEILITSSGAFCMRVNFVDGSPVGCREPELVEQLQNYLYREFIDATSL